jgi:hypothetical protein
MTVNTRINIPPARVLIVNPIQIRVNPPKKVKNLKNERINRRLSCFFPKSL